MSGRSMIQERNGNLMFKASEKYFGRKLNTGEWGEVGIFSEDIEVSLG